jgi:hypothetical protein
MSGLTTAQIEKVRERVAALPLGESDTILGSLGVATENKADANKDAAKIKLFNVKTWMLDKGRKAILGGFKQELIDELITNRN